jgi:hypothetical protein
VAITMMAIALWLWSGRCGLLAAVTSGGCTSSLTRRPRLAALGGPTMTSWTKYERSTIPTSAVSATHSDVA